MTEGRADERWMEPGFADDLEQALHAAAPAPKCARCGNPAELTVGALGFLVTAYRDNPSVELLRGTVMASCFDCGWGLDGTTPDGEYRLVCPACAGPEHLDEARAWIATGRGLFYVLKDDGAAGH